MSSTFARMAFPNESLVYPEARNALLDAPEDTGQNHRGLDFTDPVGGMLDTTPEGRGKEFFPKVDYGASDQATPLSGE
jgi:hypothetical protein